MPVAKSTRVLTEARVRQIISALIRKETRKAFSSNLTDLLAVNTPIVIDNPGSASAAVGFDLNALTSSTPVVADELMIYDINLATERKITITNLNTLLTPLTDHGLLIGLNDNDHTQYVNAAGGGLSLAAQALSLDITGLSTATPVTTDELAFFDVDAAGERKMTIAAMAGILNLTDLGTIDHESLTGRADDDHSAYMLVATGSVVDNTLAVWDGTGQRLVQDSVVTLTDAGSVASIKGTADIALSILAGDPTGSNPGKDLILSASNGSMSGINEDGGNLTLSAGSRVGSGADGFIVLGSVLNTAGNNINLAGGDLLLGVSAGSQAGVLDFENDGTVTIRASAADLGFIFKSTFDIVRLDFNEIKILFSSGTFGSNGVSTYNLTATGSTKIDSTGTGAAETVRFQINSVAAGQFQLTSGVPTFTAPLSISEPGNSLILSGGFTTQFTGGDLRLRCGAPDGGSVFLEKSDGTEIARADSATTSFIVDTVLDINAPVALGAGVTALLGLIGGSGPATAAQAQWCQIDINGTAHWIAVWV